MQKSTSIAPDWFSWEALSAGTEFDHEALLGENYKKLTSTDDQDLRKAWKALDKRYRNPSLRPFMSFIDDWREVFPYALAMKLLWEAPRGPRAEDKLTRLERERICEEIERKASKLLQLIDATDSDMPTINLAVFASIDAESDIQAQMKMIKDPPQYTSLPFSRLVTEWKEQTIRQFDPKNTLLERPNSGDPRRRYFCIKMTKFFQDYLDSPLYEAVAAFGTVLLNEPIDPDYVRFSVKTDREQIARKELLATRMQKQQRAKLSP